MKRIGNLYSKIYDMENLKLAHKNARKGKSFYKEVKMVDENPDYYLGEIQKMLINKTFKTSEYETFVKQENDKERVIYKLPYYPDRIVQWAILQVLEPILMKNLTADTYSAIPNRGIHYGLKRLKRDIKTDKKGCMYCLKFDISKYYPSIDHELLKQKYARLIKDNDVLDILNKIIDSTESGIPIGNYLSQWSGNLFLSQFDHWIKEVIGIKHYHRYMDDIVIFHSSKLFLHELKIRAERFLAMEKLEMKNNWQIFPTFIRGLDFIGYRIFDGYILLRKRTCKNLKRKLLNIWKKVRHDKLMNYHEWASINAYTGWLKWCNSYRLMQKYVKRLLPHMTKYYIINIKKGVLV